MKQILTLLFLLICLKGYSQTQMELNEQAQEAFNKTDRELNIVYKKLLPENKTDTEFVKNLDNFSRCRN